MGKQRPKCRHQFWRLIADGKKNQTQEDVTIKRVSKK